MPISSRYILHQGPVVAALARTAFMAAHQKGAAGAAPVVPGPELSAVLPPRPADLVRDYVRWVGGEPGSYKGALPPHLFPQWVFPLQARGLEGLPYPLAKVLNGGCAVEINGPLPANEPLDVRIRLESVDDNGQRAVIHQRSVTGTKSQPEALIAHNYVIVPLGGKSKGNGAPAKKAKKERPLVPVDAREVLFRKLGPKSGLDFAKLTGDFNPIHWLPPAAKASGFPNVILHGFATMAIAMEAVVRGVYSGDVSAVTRFDVRFTRPLVLPAKVGVFVDDGNQVYVGDAPGGPAYLIGSYNLDRSEP